MSRMKQWVSKTSHEDINDLIVDPKCSPELIMSVWNSLRHDVSDLIALHASTNFGPTLAKVLNENPDLASPVLPKHLQANMVPFDKDPAIGSLVNKTDVCLDNERKGFPTCLHSGDIYFVGEEERAFQWVPTEEQAQELAEGEV
jgi:hypothetical protein